MSLRQPARESATQRKDLLAGRSVWQAGTGTGVPFKPLVASLRADIAIVGAGISGAFLAHALAGRADRIVVVDRRSPVSGSTAASTAMLQFEIDVPLIRLSDKIGAEKAKRAWLESYRATQDIVRLVRAERIACGLETRNALYLTGNTLGHRAMEREWRARHRIGLPGRFLPQAQLREEFRIDRSGGILSPGSAAANPRQLAAGLLRRSIAKGVEVYAPVTITDVLATAHGTVLATDRHFIEARRCVFCTGYELLKGMPRAGTKITSTWAVASSKASAYPSWMEQTLLWEAAKPYLYMRTTPDGRILIGGEDEDIDLPSYRVRNLAHKSARLLQKAKRLVPDLAVDAAFQWTGAFGESEDGLPIIDAIPDMPGCFAVMGFGGNGTVYSVIASRIVPALLAGRRPKNADLYRFRGT